MAWRPHSSRGRPMPPAFSEVQVPVAPVAAADRGAERQPAVSLHRAAQRREHRMLRFARIHRREFLPPPLQQTQTLGLVPDLVAHWMQGYIARHHVDAPFEKRRRKRHAPTNDQRGEPAIEEDEFG